MLLNFKSSDMIYSLSVPEWFMAKRGNGIHTFNKLVETYGYSPEVDTYFRMRSYMSKFPKESVFLDIGANLGIISIPIALAGYKVISVEPSKENIGYLTDSIKINNLQGKITVLPYAASDKDSDMDLYVSEQGDCNSISKTSAEVVGSMVTSEKVKSIRLDDWINASGVDKIKFIKIDVQGYEYNVLMGLEKLLTRDEERHVLLECETKLLKNFNKKPDDIFKFMSSYGFKAYSWGHDDILFVKQ